MTFYRTAFLVVRGSARALALVCVLTSCGVGSIDTSPSVSIGNDETFAALNGMWSGVRSAIESKRETSTSTFNIPLSYQLPCPRGGQRSYQGTLTGTKSGSSGTATLTMTATLTGCQFDNTVSVTEVTANAVTANGAIAILNDVWSTTTIRMVATAVTVNGKVCPGGMDVVISGTSPSAQVISTGTSCGRAGAVPLQ